MTLFRIVLVSLAVAWASFLGWGVARIWNQNNVRTHHVCFQGVCTGDD